jgi:hypothetical protein
MIEMNRPQRIDILVRSNAPSDLLENEVRLAVKEYMEQDSEKTLKHPLSWPMAAWALVVALKHERQKSADLEKQIRQMQRKPKGKEAAQ